MTLLLRWQVARKFEALQVWLVWRLPRRLVYWAVIRVWAHATTATPAWQHDTPDSIGWNEALKRWEQAGPMRINRS